MGHNVIQYYTVKKEQLQLPAVTRQVCTILLSKRDLTKDSEVCDHFEMMLRRTRFMDLYY